MTAVLGWLLSSPSRMVAVALGLTVAFLMVRLSVAEGRLERAKLELSEQAAQVKICAARLDVVAVAQAAAEDKRRAAVRNRDMERARAEMVTKRLRLIPSPQGCEAIPGYMKQAADELRGQW